MTILRLFCLYKLEGKISKFGLGIETVEFSVPYSTLKVWYLSSTEKFT